MREGQEGVLEDRCILVVGTTGSRVAAVVWTVVPQERRDARLQRQAEFIDQFRAGGRIWDYVVIIAKQPGGFNLERAVEGGREAALARLGAEGGNVQALGFTYLDSSISAVQRAKLLALPEEQRRGLLVVTALSRWETRASCPPTATSSRCCSTPARTCWSRNSFAVVTSVLGCTRPEPAALQAQGGGSATSISSRARGPPRQKCGP